MRVRSERIEDIPRIRDITEAAFANQSHSSHTEHLVINALRKAGALALSLVAEIEDKLVGHVTFSAVTISDGSDAWYGLGPVSVHPDFQSQGIGTTLITQGLSSLNDKQANGCVVLGEPDYYWRFGFKNNYGLILENFPQEYFLALPFNDSVAQGVVAYHPAFLVNK